MKILTGIDIVELERFRNIRFFDRVAEIVLTKQELELMSQSRDRYQYLASRFALKEAVIKAWPLKLGPQDFEILKSGLKPIVYFTKEPLIQADISVSLTHSITFAAAMAVVSYS